MRKELQLLFFIHSSLAIGATNYARLSDSPKLKAELTYDCSAQMLNNQGWEQLGTESVKVSAPNAEIAVYLLLQKYRKDITTGDKLNLKDKINKSSFNITCFSDGLGEYSLAKQSFDERRYRAAIEYFEKSLVTAQRGSDIWLEIIEGLIKSHQELGNFDKAREYLELFK